MCLTTGAGLGGPLGGHVTMVTIQPVKSQTVQAEEREREADHPSSLVALFGTDQPLRLDCGVDLAPFQLA